MSEWAIDLSEWATRMVFQILFLVGYLTNVKDSLI